MRSFSYVLAACVVTALAVIAVPALVSRPLERMVRRWIALPLCTIVVVSDRDGRTSYVLTATAFEVDNLLTTV